MERTAALAGLNELWKETLGDQSICIAIIDGPVDLTHPAFSGARLHNLETLVPATAGNDAASRHGTHVASTIFGQPGSSVRGIAPGCRGLVVPVFSGQQGGALTCSQLDLARAITLALDNGAHIINISGGELADGGQADPILAQAIQQCVNRGTLVVAAAGNDGCACVHVPAAHPAVLAVGAMDGAGAPLASSNWGAAYQRQGVLALGHRIPGAVPNGGIVEQSGTSFATPFVSGIAALLASVQSKRGTAVRPLDVRAAILETAAPCDSQAPSDCRKLLAGRLNIAAAHARVSGHISTVAPATEATRFTPATTHPAATPETQRSQQPQKETRAMTEQQSPPPPLASESADAGISAAEFPPLASETPATSAGIQPSAIQPSECTCPKSKVAPSIAYVLGQVGYDFGSESKRDGFLQLAGTGTQSIAGMLDHLEKNPAAAANLIWTLSVDATVIYAIMPYGPYANIAYDRLKEFLRAQIQEGVERVSIPGLIHGSVRLLNGQQVPVIFPEVRGMYAWTTNELITNCCGKVPDNQAEQKHHNEKVAGIRNFLDRVYYEIRNLGATSPERAMNYAATNAFQISSVYSDAIKTGMKLDNIAVERSPLCRPGADCWDVKLMFFNPAKRLEQARHVYRFTVDVSEIIPVTVGHVRHWDIY